MTKPKTTKAAKATKAAKTTKAANTTKVAKTKVAKTKVAKTKVAKTKVAKTKVAKTTNAAKTTKGGSVTTASPPRSMRQSRRAAEEDVILLLATERPSFLPDLPATSPRKEEPPLLGEALPALFRCGFPHIRFADAAQPSAPLEETQEMFFGNWTGVRLMRSASVWSRFVRAYAGNVKVLSSNPATRSFTKEAKEAMANDSLVSASEVPGLVRQLLSSPGSARSREWTEDFVYALEALSDPEVVCDAIVSVFEAPPPGKALPQMTRLIEDVGMALGFVRLRVGPAARKSLDKRLAALLESPSKRFPTPTVRLEAFLFPERVPRGALRIDGTFAVTEVLHTTDRAAILATLERFQPKDSPLFLLDPRLVFLAGSDAVPLYLSKFAAYERALHPNVAALQLAAFVDAIAPFLDARVGAWLEGLTKHVHVGRRAEDWLQARR